MNNYVRIGKIDCAARAPALKRT